MMAAWTVGDDQPTQWTGYRNHSLLSVALTQEPDLYALIQNNTIRQVGALPWVQPTGAHDAYSFGATVTHTGRVWESTVAGERSNTWAPGVYGWKDLGPA